MNIKGKNSIIKAVTCALLAAVLCVSAQISIPFPSGIPFTLQTFAVAFCASAGGLLTGTVSVLIYILLGIFGLPVFSSFRGGLSVVLGPTGGFILGFLPFAVLSGIEVKNKFVKMLFSVSGLVVCHVFGIVQYALISHNGFIQSFILVSLPFIIKDVISVIAAQFLAVTVKKALSKSIPALR